MPKWTSRREKMNETLGNILNSFLQDCGISSIVALEIPLLQKSRQNSMEWFPSKTMTIVAENLTLSGRLT